MTFAVLCLFVSSAFETTSLMLTLSTSSFGSAILFADAMMYAGYSRDKTAFLSRSVNMTLFFLLVHVLEVVITANSIGVVYTSILKPLTLAFAYPTSTETSLRAFTRVFPSTCRVLAFQVFMIYLFSLLAYSMFAHDKNFTTIFHSFVTLFALSTSVNNPACWMPLYAESRINAVFFIFFLLFSFFYTQKLVLAVVMDGFNANFRRVVRERDEVRKECLRRSFESIARAGSVNKGDAIAVFDQLRPHYAKEKVEILWKVLAKDKNCVKIQDWMTGAAKVVDSMVRHNRRRKRRSVPGLDFVRVSLDTLPALSGPLILTLSILHIFCYIGMITWQGRIGPWLGDRGGQFYYLNSFNSYFEGLVTLFNLMVVNDWHQIALVYSDPSVSLHEWASYFYFIAVILLLSMVMVQIVTAFFINGFFSQQRRSRERQRDFEENMFDREEGEHLLNVSQRGSNYLKLGIGDEDILDLEKEEDIDEGDLAALKKVIECGGGRVLFGDGEEYSVLRL